ncbi:MAG TPA: hypothetical protein VFF31_22105 [Blastocatellia bacterium]|nr:hypothetical protein [Blastocatellia bacterium]
MSSVSRTALEVRFDRAERLKTELVEFVTKGKLRPEYELQQNLFFEAAHPDDEHEAESVLDWFLFDWFDESGEGVIARYLDSESSLDEADREILLDWQDSINSVFEIRSSAKNSLQLSELDSGDSYTVKTRLDNPPFKRGQFIIARLLPLGDDLIFSGLQFLMPDRESALAWLEMRRAFDAFDSPEAIEKAQREQVAAFCELFGSDELTVPSSKLSPTLERFQRYLINERRDPETGMTPAERFQKELGQELSIPQIPPLPQPVLGAGEVTILCDDFDGIVLLPEFNRFKRVFESDEPDRQVPDWRELIWAYIKNPEIPIVAFERVAEQFPLRVEKVIRTLIGEKDFSLEHLYAVLLHYKQPVDELKELKDDQHLWDLFNRNEPATKSRKGKAKAAKLQNVAKAAKLQNVGKAAKLQNVGKAAKKKPQSKASPKQTSKKPKVSSRKSTTRVSGIKRTPTAKLKRAAKSKPLSRRTPTAETRVSRSKSAKKR